jgi:hypothetical protein
LDYNVPKLGVSILRVEKEYNLEINVQPLRAERQIEAVCSLPLMKGALPTAGLSIPAVGNE